MPSTASEEGKSKNHDRTKKELFNKAMKGKWKEVLDIYRENSWTHGAKITRSGGTALHIAVSDGQEDVVEELVNIIVKTWKVSRIENGVSHAKKFLIIGDELGNTPLHTAATLGNVKMCRCIASVDKSLIGARNKDSETPFFMAALHGHKHAFLCLNSLCGTTTEGYEYSRRNNGETILHCAISGDYFDLAFQIIHFYKDLVNSVNELGLSPLHLLAAKPSAFRSGSHLGRCKSLIYHCIFVDKLEVEKLNNQSSTTKLDKKKPVCPPNYETCYNLFRLLWKAIRVVTSIATKGMEDEGKSFRADTENPAETGKTAAQATEERGKNPQETKALDDDNIKAQGHQLLPPNYSGWFEFVKLVSKAMLIILGLGSTSVRKLREKKEKHTWSVQVMNKLLQLERLYEYEDDGRKPLPPSSGQEEDGEETKPYVVDDIVSFYDSLNNNDKSPTSFTSNVPEAYYQEEKKDDKNADDKNHADKKQEVLETKKTESPILIAAKNGITEIVEKILEMFPVAIHDMNYQKKNVVLLAVENRQPHVYKLLLEITNMKESVFRKVDHEGNSALHLAARLGDRKPWLIPGAALQMQWEIKWYEFVKESMPFHFFVRYNKENQSPRDVFTKTHQELVKTGGEWLTNTSESCSVVAALIATVAFATSTTVPGGINAVSGTPTLENQPAFNVFAISSLVALCFSVTAVVMFLAILTSRYQERDFGKDLPRKLLLGLTSLFVSIASILICFCAGHFFVLKDKLKYAALPVYAVTCLPITFFAIAQFPLYFDLVWATFKKVPQRSYKSVPI